MPTSPTTPPLARLALEAEIIPLRNAAQAALEQYEGTRLLFADQLDPERATQDLRRQIESATTATQVATLQARLGGLSSSRDEARRAAIRETLTAFAPAKAALVALAVKARQLLDTYATEAQTAEQTFFTQFGLPREATTASTRVATAINQLEDLRGRIGEAHGPLPPVTSPLLGLLGG